jgi:hypothetical protein
MSAPSGVGLGHQSALLSIQSVAAFCDSSFPTLCNEGAFELALLFLSQCGRRKCQKCHDDFAKHRHLPKQKNTTNGVSRSACRRCARSLRCGDRAISKVSKTRRQPRQSNSTCPQFKLPHHLLPSRSMPPRVCFWHKADMTTVFSDARFWEKSGLSEFAGTGPNRSISF